LCRSPRRLLLEQRALARRISKLNGALDRHRTVWKDVSKLSPVIGEHPAHEQPTMAVARLPFAADQGKAVRARALEQALDGGAELRLLGHRAVEGVPLGVVMLATRWPAAKFLSQEEIADPCSANRVLQLLAIEPRSKAGVWKRPDVNEELDVLAGEQA
jgi:hypothetical protein